MLADLLSRLNRFLWWTAQPRHNKTSRFLRSSCCDAPVVQHYEREPDLLPVVCAKCGTELGAPGIEDVSTFLASEWRLVEQWGCDGKSPNVNACTAACPRASHHHHDRRCLPPALVQIDQAVDRAG